jgi:hypothetical protein
MRTGGACRACITNSPVPERLSADCTSDSNPEWRACAGDGAGNDRPIRPRFTTGGSAEKFRITILEFVGFVFLPGGARPDECRVIRTELAPGLISSRKSKDYGALRHSRLRALDVPSTLVSRPPSLRGFCVLSIGFALVLWKQRNGNWALVVVDCFRAPRPQGLPLGPSHDGVRVISYLCYGTYSINHLTGTLSLLPIDRNSPPT